MDRKEEIIHAALELASEKGLGSLSMQQIADRIGIKKPSLYNHFASKDEIVSAMYAHFRGRAKEKAASGAELDIGEALKNMPPVQLLKAAVSQYADMSRQDRELMMFYKVLYSERASNPEAAAILAEEAKRMVIATKNLFYAFQAQGLMSFTDIDRAAEGFAFGVHGMMDYQMDRETSGESFDPEMINRFAEWFCGCFSADSTGKENA